MIWSDFGHFRMSGSIICRQLLLSMTRCVRSASSLPFIDFVFWGCRQEISNYLSLRFSDFVFWFVWSFRQEILNYLSLRFSDFVFWFVWGLGQEISNYLSLRFSAVSCSRRLFSRNRMKSSVALKVENVWLPSEYWQTSMVNFSILIIFDL